MSWSAATVSSSTISASAASSAISTCSGPELVAGAKRAGAIGAARPRFAPMLSGKEHCWPASIHLGTHLGCGAARCSAIGEAGLGAATSAYIVPMKSSSHALGGAVSLFLSLDGALDGGPGGNEGEGRSRDFDVEASEPSEVLALFCTFCA